MILLQKGNPEPTSTGSVCIQSWTDSFQRLGIYSREVKDDPQGLHQLSHRKKAIDSMESYIIQGMRIKGESDMN